MIKTVDITTFKRDSSFYAPFDLLLTIKNFDLQAIRKRYLESKRNNSGKVGSVERRPVAKGGLAQVRLEKGQLTNTAIIAELKEPRGIAKHGNLLGIATENEVHLVGKEDIKSIKDPWFSYIHTLDFRGDRVLISSSGLDCIFEYDTNTLQRTNEWFAWDNGFNRSFDAELDQHVYITRHANQAEEYKQQGHPYLLINDPKEQVLPTAKRTAFINSVVYAKDGGNSDLLATFFHQGTVRRIDLNSGDNKLVLSELKHPHGGNQHGTHYMATSTATGEVVLGSEDEQTRYAFAQLPGKPTELSDAEWLQNSIVVGDNIVTIDSNRTSFVIFNPDLQLFDVIPYDHNWAVQDMVVEGLLDSQKTLLQTLSISAN